MGFFVECFLLSVSSRFCLLSQPVLVNISKRQAPRQEHTLLFVSVSCRKKAAAFEPTRPSLVQRSEPPVTGEESTLTFPALSPSVCDLRPLLLERLCKVHDGSRGIRWQEAFWEVVRADITHPIMQSCKQLQLAAVFLFFFLSPFTHYETSAQSSRHEVSFLSYVTICMVSNQRK